MEDADAIDGLKRLGLTTYEARVFLGLQKLGSATASEVSEVADVPRSQVYGAAEELEKRGLVETQQSTPTVYQPVPLDQARTQLLDQLAQTGSETFDYLETVKNTAQHTERTESIWMINGDDAISSRTVNLIEETEEKLLYGVDDPELLTAEILNALEEAVARDVTVVISSANQPVLSKAEERQLDSYRVPAERDLDVDTVRLFVADDQTILLSTLTGPTEQSEEVAFWTSENAFAAVLGELAQAWLQEPFR